MNTKTGTPTRNTVTDVLEVLDACDVEIMHRQPLRWYLAERWPDTYGDWTPARLTDQLRASGVPLVNIKIGGQVLKGVKAEDVRTAAPAPPAVAPAVGLVRRCLALLVRLPYLLVLGPLNPCYWLVKGLSWLIDRGVVAVAHRRSRRRHIRECSHCRIQFAR